MVRARSWAVVLTSACNFACSYCYQDSKNAARMRWSTLRAVLESMARSGHERVELSFIGGEPLLEIGAIRKAVQWVEGRSSAAPQFTYSVITNGTLLSDRMIDFLVRHAFDLQLSCDGVDAAQDQRRPGTFARLDRLLDALLRGHPEYCREHLTINMTATPGNLPYLAESVRYLLDKGVPDIAIAADVRDRPEWRLQDIETLDDQFSQVYEASLHHFLRRDRIPLRLLRARRRALQASSTPVTTSCCEPDAHAESAALCSVGSGDALVVDVDGSVCGCPLLAFSYRTPTGPLADRLRPLAVGDLRATTFPRRYEALPAALRRTELFHGREYKYSGYGRCADCRFGATCGVCPLSTTMIAGNADPHRVPDFACAFQKVAGKYREKFP